jgi:hypothetical protein
MKQPSRPTATAWAVALLLLVSTCGKPRLTGGGATPAPGPGDPPAAGGTARPGFTLPPAGPPAAADAGSPPAPGGTCAAEARQAKRLPLDLLFVVDKSESMNLQISNVGTQWDLVREALMRFVQDPGSAGLGVGLQLFPLVQKDVVCTQDSDCEPDLLGQMLPVATVCLPEQRILCSGTGRPCTTVGQACSSGLAGDVCVQLPRTCRSRGFAQCDANYTDPLVPVAPLPAAFEPFGTRLVYTLPSGQTPIFPAVRGGLTHLRQRLQADPERRPALVLVTDGFPLGCPEQIPQIAEIVAAAYRATPSISTFVIGVFSGSSNAQATFDQLAVAGGTAPAVIVEPNVDLTARFLATLERIREAALPCEFDIPPPRNGPLDFSRVNLRWQGASSMEEVLYVERPDRCDATRGGWYYDVPPAQGRPTRVLVCPATCGRFKSEPDATVELSFGCQTRTID